jgi:addiction module HigA family antidote
MNAPNKNIDNNLKLEIGLTEAGEWNKEKTAQVDDFIKKLAAKRSPEQKLKNEMLSLRYQMEDYIEANELKKILTIDSFLKSYLSILKVSSKKFAVFIDMKDSNLKKYVTGERKFNTNLAMKFSQAFNTPPDIWLKLQVKNELWELHKEKKQANQYKKYNVGKLMKLADQ